MKGGMPFVDMALMVPQSTGCVSFAGKAVSISNYKGSILFMGPYWIAPNKYIDITEIVHQKKKQLISLYPSQLKAQNYQHLSKWIGCMEVLFLPISSRHEAFRGFMEILAESY